MFRRRRGTPPGQPTHEIRLDVDLGRTDLDALITRTERLLAAPDTAVVLSMSSFTYFDALMLDRLTALVEQHRDRVRLEGTETVADRLLTVGPDPDDVTAALKQQDRAQAGVVRVNSVVVVNLTVDGEPLTDAEAEAAFARVVVEDSPLVAIDFLGRSSVSPALTLAVAELSGDLAHADRTLLCVNAEPDVAAALRLAGLSVPAVIQASGGA
jgi:hypothetical protein